MPKRSSKLKTSGPVRTWRCKAVQKAGGAYWLLERGSRETLDRITLGYATQAQAEGARDILEADERRPWSRTTDDGVTVETKMSVAGYLAYLWKHGRPPFPGPDLVTDGPDTDTEVTPDLERTRGGIRAYLVDGKWKAVEDLFNNPDTCPPALLTLREYFDRHYRAWRAADRPKTWRTEEGYWRRILRDHPEGLGNIAVGDLDSNHVHDYLAALKVERPRPGEGVQVGDPMSGASKALHRAALQAMMTCARLKRHIDARPDLAEFDIRGRTRKVREQADPLDLEEVARLLDVAPSPMHRALFGLGVGGGLRPSELIRVQWEDLDVTRWETISIRPDATGEGKTEASVAVIPLTPLAASEMRRWWEARKRPSSGVAFLAPRSRADAEGIEPYATSTGYKKALDTACKKAGITRHITPYILRHTTATICWALGIDIDVCRRIMRHTDEAMIRKVYARPRPSDIAKRLESFRLPTPAPAVTTLVVTEPSVSILEWLGL